MLNVKFITYRVGKFIGGTFPNPIPPSHRPRAIKDGSIHDTKRRHDLEIQYRDNQESRIEPIAKEILDRFELKVLKEKQAQEWIKTLWNKKIINSLRTKIDTIMVAYDGTPLSLYALNIAKFFANHDNSELIITMIQTEESKKPKFPKISTLNKPPQNLILPPGNIAQSLIKTALEENVSLIVMGSEGRQGKELVLHASVAEEVLKQVSCPVLVTKSSHANFKLNKILVPIDGTKFSYEAIIQGIHLSQNFNAELYIIHISQDEQQIESDENLEKIMNAIDWHSAPHKIAEEEGEIVAAITDYSKKNNIDLIIMGTHSKLTQMKESITTQVVQNSPCPVWVIHPETR